MNNLIQYGPYSPQELDRASKWLQGHLIAFEIIRNDQDAKEALMNDGQNVVNLADLRTGIYLAQIFYINLKNPTEAQKKDFESRFTEKSESFLHQGAGGVLSEGDEDLVAKASRKNHFKKRAWATILAAAIIIQIIYSLYHLFLKEKF
ncbi:MAG: hypothetical protein H7061_06840 [Bdellovibrionaceae bacterium]|nr:hypothetical protein [Bdellovibrio sp.]